MIRFVILMWMCIQGIHLVNAQDILLADPTVFYQNNCYYLYGTGSPDGIWVYTSSNMNDWKGPIGAIDGLALKRGHSFGTQGFWAPQLFVYQGKYCMMYTANEQIAIARSESPVGPFMQDSIRSIPADRKQIDPYVFFDEDGKIYLYHVRLNQGNRIYVAELDASLSAMKEGTLKECISATEPWENTANAEWPVCEGPTVIKEDGKYYMFYSANDFRNKDYAVGYAIADSPNGPWHKYENNPILHQGNIKHPGTGHGDLMCNGLNEFYYVFHVHQSALDVAPRKTAIVQLSVTPVELGNIQFEILPETFRLLFTE